MKLSEVLNIETIVPELSSSNKPDILKELSSYISLKYSNVNENKIFETLLDRENICSTAVDEGVAIPHGKLSGLNNIITMVARKKDGVDFDSLDGNLTNLFILVLSPIDSSGQHINLLARISKIFKDQNLRAKLLEAETKEQIYEILIEEDEKLQ